MTTWRVKIAQEMESRRESWADVESCTLTDDDLDVEFDCGYYGSTGGKPFTLWTKNRVYYPVMYDGDEWCESVPRNPCDEAKRHSGGG